jgi:predicted CoA-substrate-specific enzyme activase
MENEYWKWPEFSAGGDDLKRSGGDTVTAGVDVGTTSTQAAVVRGGALLGYSSIHTGADFKKAAEKALNMALAAAGVARSDVSAIIGTGFGRENIAFASKTVDEIHCHAKGARFIFGPEVRTVVDMGGQTVKAIRLFEWDRVRDFMLNDKCATGQGRNIEVLCNLLHIDITGIGPKSLEAEKDPEPVSTTCLAFANTETLGLFGRPEFKSEKLSEAEIYASHMFAVAWRIIGVIGRLSPLDVGEIKIDGALAFTGGLAKNPGITRRIERELGVTALTGEYDPMLAGAIGAALS